MPFSGPGDPELPDHIKKLSATKRKQWVGAWNSAFATCQKEGAGDCEGRAFRIANAAIKETDMDNDLKDGIGGEEGLPVTGDGELTTEAKDGKFLVEAVDSHYHYVAPVFGAQSWNELDAAEEAQEKVSQVYEITYFFKSLMQNILDDPELDPDQKSDLLDAAVAGLRPRLAAVKELESVEGTKQATKTEDGVAYRARDFAVVPDPEKPSGWKLRLAEGNSGNVTRAQVARAITAMQPGGFRGNTVQLGPGDKAQAKRRIRAAINKASGSDDQKAALRGRLDKVKEGVFKKAAAVIGGWLKAEKGLDLATTGVTVFKDANDKYRWLATVTNRWRDRDNPPEIFEAKAHRNFVEYLDRGGVMPEFWLWHTPGTAIGKADWVTYDGGFLLASGTFYEGMEDQAERLSKMKGLGISHGYKYIYSDANRGIIGQYRSFEISALPHERAANAFTGLDIVSKEAMMEITPTKRAFLVGVMGEEKVAALEKKHTTMADALEEAGVESKDLPEEPEVKADDTAGKGAPEGTLQADLAKALAGLPPEEAKALVEKMLVDGAVAMKQMAEGLSTLTTSVVGVTTDLKALTARVDGLAKSDDEKIADALTSKVKKGDTNGQRATDSDKNIVKDVEGEGPKSPIDKGFMESLQASGAPTPE